MTLPQSDILSTRYLNRVFDKTVATYKYYWLLGLLEEVVLKGNRCINIWDMIVSMVANAWYPVVYFRLSFGKSESLYETILKLQQQQQIPINLSKKELTARLYELIQHKEIRDQLNFLQLNVPFWFLRPWIDTTNPREIEVRSQSWENGCLYRLVRIGGVMHVEVNAQWTGYLQENYTILTSFAYWNLTNFLQARNPNVPNISGKLIKPEERNSLSKQREFWNTAINNGLEVHCLYTGKILTPRHYDLDHFIPWSFVSHDQIWNLMPADSSINSSKSNHLPNLDYYLPHLAEAQQAALRINLQLNCQPKLLEDYFSLGFSPQEIVAMDHEHLLNCFKKTFEPMSQIAENMGFETWKYTQS